MENNAQKVVSQIDILIRSRYPVIYITTWEEERVIAILKKLLSSYKQKRKVYTWSTTDGLRLDEAGSSNENLNINDMLDYIYKNNEVAAYILKDIHKYYDDYKVVRRIRDIYQQARKTYKNVIIISPCFKIPDEIQKEVTVIDFPLPNLPELKSKLEDIIVGLRSNPNIQINLSPESKEELLKAALGLTLNEAENVFAKAIVKDQALDESDIQEVLFEKQQIIKKTGVLEYCHVSEHMDDIGGLENLKEWLIKRSKAFSFKAKQYGLPFPKGVLLLGVQGCGKSLCAKAMASVWNMPLIKLDVGRVFSSYMGNSEENIRNVIKISESVAPCVLWVDEAEKAFAGVKSSGMTDGGTTSRVFATFISWLQDKTSPVFVIATVNDISSLPPEFLRKGRFDEIFFVDLPHLEERLNIFKIIFRRYKISKQIADIEQLATKTEGFSGAEIEQVVISSMFDAFDEDKSITKEHLLTNIEIAVPLSKTMPEEIQRLRQWSKVRTRPASAPYIGIKKALSEMLE